MAHGLRQLADQTPRALRDLDQVRAGLRELLGEGSREHRIGIVVIVGETIERGLPGARRKDREHAFGQLRHRREAAAAGDRTGALAFERIVAAGIEHQDRGAHLLVLHALDDAVGEDRSVAHQFFLPLGRGRHVGRKQKVLPGDLEAVAGIEEERGVARPDRLVERQQRLAERGPRLVLRDHHGKAELLQRIAHGAGVVDRLLQFRNVPVIVVADHQRDALFRMRGGGERHQGGRNSWRSPTVWKANASSSSPPARLIHGPCQPSYAVVGRPAQRFNPCAGAGRGAPELKWIDGRSAAGTLRRILRQSPAVMPATGVVLRLVIRPVFMQKH